MRGSIVLTLLLHVVVASACRTPALPAASSALEDEATGYDCIRRDPIDGYQFFAPAQADRVTRRTFRDDMIVPDEERVAVPNEQQVRATMRNIGAHVRQVNQTAPPGSADRRNEVYHQGGGTPEPYCLFHPPGRAIYGTVILLHGFNDRPQQQAKLASYLFHGGFNIYNVFLSHHYQVPGTRYWPRLLYRPEFAQVLAAKFAKPGNREVLLAMRERLAGGQITQADMADLDRILRDPPNDAEGPFSLALLKSAWVDPHGAAFRRLYQVKDPSAAIDAQPSDFYDYVREAQARLSDLAPMPGPIFVSGLSVGGTVAQGLAIADGGERIRAVVSQAPWIQSVNANARLNIILAGPLDDKVGMVGGAYPMEWPNHRVPFSPASIAADAALGAWVTGAERIKVAARIPHAFLTTAVDNSADNGAAWELYQKMNAGPTEGLHQWAQYARERNVAHAITDPENYRNDNAGPDQGGSWNRYWRSLYQEIWRFYVTGYIHQDHFQSRDLDPALPGLNCNITHEFAYRCNQ